MTVCTLRTVEDSVDDCCEKGSKWREWAYLLLQAHNLLLGFLMRLLLLCQLELRIRHLQAKHRHTNEYKASSYNE